MRVSESHRQHRQQRQIANHLIIHHKGGPLDLIQQIKLGYPQTHTALRRMNEEPAFCEHHPHPRSANEQTSAISHQSALFQVSVDYSVNNTFISFSCVLVFVTFIVYLVWDICAHQRNLHLRSLSDWVSYFVIDSLLSCPSRRYPKLSTQSSVHWKHPNSAPSFIVIYLAKTTVVAQNLKPSL